MPAAPRGARFRTAAMAATPSVAPPRTGFQAVAAVGIVRAASRPRQAMVATPKRSATRAQPANRLCTAARRAGGFAARRVRCKPAPLGGAVLCLALTKGVRAGGRALL